MVRPNFRLGPAVPDPFDDADALEELGEQIATLSAHIDAATYRMLVLIADFDGRRGFELGGHRSCAHWIAFRTGTDLGAARERVRTARVLETLPRISEAMSEGKLSYSAVRALTRGATPENEGELLEFALGATTAEIERMVRGRKLGDCESEIERDRVRHASRGISLFPGDDGMVRVRGQLTPEVGALLMRAIEAASDALFRESPPEADAMRHETERLRDAARRRADALALIAERAMAAGFGGSDAPAKGTRAERYQVVLHVDAEHLAGDPSEGRDRCHFEDGTRVSAETARRIACDAAVVPVVHDEDGSILNVGRRRRTVPPAIRRALEARDGGCRFPGCNSRFTHAHHMDHWAAGGETSLANGLLLCDFHHPLVHEGGWRVEWWGDGVPVFIDPRGGTHFEGRRASPVVASDPVAALMEENARHGADPDGWTGAARWPRRRDIPDEVLFRAVEAVMPRRPLRE